MAPVAVIVVYVVAGLLWEIVLSVVLGAVAVAAGRGALRSGGSPDKPREHAATRPRQPFVIMNPRSGGGKVAKFGLDDKATARGARVTLLEYWSSTFAKRAPPQYNVGHERHSNADDQDHGRDRCDDRQVGGKIAAPQDRA